MSSEDRYFGMIVPGPSDLAFWQHIRKRGLLPQVKRVVHARGDSRMISDAVKHQETMVALELCPVFVRDLDEAPCVTDVLQRFRAVGSPTVVVARRCLETWLLADPIAICAVWRNTRWEPPSNVETIADPEGKLHELARRNNRARLLRYEKTAHAVQFAEHFDLTRAAGRSPSLKRLLTTLAIREA